MNALLDAPIRRVDAENEVVGGVRDPEGAEAPCQPGECVLGIRTSQGVAVDLSSFCDVDARQVAAGREPDAVAVGEIPGGVAAERRANVPEDAAVARVDL